MRSIVTGSRRCGCRRSQALADICSRSVNTDRPAREVIATDFPQYEHCTEQILPLLTAIHDPQAGRGLLDFDDLLVAWRALLAEPVVGARLRARWDHVLVDEYQDVNQIQVDIVTALRPDGLGLTVVGDDAQAVYGFRGAPGSHLFDLAVTLPRRDVVRLERNFRSVQPLLDLANVIRPAGDAAQQIVLRADRDGRRRGRPLHHCYDADDQARLRSRRGARGTPGRAAAARSGGADARSQSQPSSSSSSLRIGASRS